VLIDSEFALEQMEEAHARMESNLNTGKIVIQVADPDAKEL